MPKGNGLAGSMGRIGACGDYAALESFFALLRKNGLAREYGLSRETVYQYRRRGQGPVPAGIEEETNLPA